MNVVFDWAGTLADDQELTWRLTDRVIRRFGGAGVGYEAYRKEFSLPAQGFYARYAPGADWDAVEAEFAALCRAEYPAGVRLWPGVKDGLHALAGRHRLYLLTSLDQGMVEEALEALGLRRLFAAVKGSARDKTAALPELLREHGLHQDETLAVGDLPHDAAAARAAGIQSLAVTYGYGSAEALRAEGPEALADDFAGVLRHLDKLACAEARHFPVATVGGLIHDDDGRILLVRTRKWSGLYGIPGGKIDYGETMEAAFAREAREETGLEIGGIAFVLNQDCIEHPEFYRPRHFILVNFTARARGSRPAVRLNHEGDGYRWALPGEALAMPLNAPTRLLIEAVHPGAGKGAA
jgi:phosphoglycolate phosphatase-like HAD superfamily hydrolase/ADP-ribose pyrophosphatase YjhB (NUDIX family)